MLYEVITELALIVQRVALTGQPVEQVNLVVESISTAMGVDVCSLYLANADGEMQLLASVITSYSIHYTKLYDPVHRKKRSHRTQRDGG